MSDAATSEHTIEYPGFWEAARAGRFEVQHCQGCKRLRYFPAPLCPHCLSTESVWKAVSGKGTLYASTTVHRAPNAAMAKETPYTISFIDLAEGVRVMARLESIPADGARIGMPVAFAGVGESGAGPWLRFQCEG